MIVYIWTYFLSCIFLGEYLSIVSFLVSKMNSKNIKWSYIVFDQTIFYEIMIIFMIKKKKNFKKVLQIKKKNQVYT